MIYIHWAILIIYVATIIGAIFAVLITANVLLSYFSTAVMKMIPGLKKLI